MSNSPCLGGGKRAMTWEPIWALPNIDLDEPVESPIFALVPASDPRVELLKREHGSFRTFMSRFQDTHGNRISPTLIIRRTDAPEPFRKLDVAASFRDLLVASTVPLARSRTIIDGRNLYRVNYSSFFWVYPWMLDQRYEKIIADTPATLALDDVDQFRGHSSPELSRTTLLRRDFDEPLLQELLLRWRARYETANPQWADVALFRSLNMANRACLLPAGADVVIHDDGRMAGLWTAAFEILVHPGGDGRANLYKVFDLLQKIPWIDKTCAYRRFPIRRGRRREQKDLACWLYNRISSCRNDFLHGNPVTHENLLLPESGRPLTSHAATLYRLALSSFLDLTWKEPLPEVEDAQAFAASITRMWEFQEPQNKCEEALKLCRVSVAEQRRNQANRMNQ